KRFHFKTFTSSSNRRRGKINEAKDFNILNQTPIDVHKFLATHFVVQIPQITVICDALLSSNFAFDRGKKFEPMFRDSLGKSQDVYSLNSCQNHMFTGMIDFGLLHMCASSEECFYGGLHFAPVIFNHRKQFEAINSDKYTRLIFDRGRECDESVSMDKYNDDFDGDDYCDNELYVKRTKRSQGTGCSTAARIFSIGATLATLALPWYSFIKIQWVLCLLKRVQ
ncbi:hypothetical protein C5167_019521, partial [Papaver somniferum]